MSTAAHNLPRWLAVALVIGVADQVTKYCATSYLEYAIPMAVFPGFNLTLLHNTGAAFSLFHDQAGWQRWLFSAIAAIVAVIVVIWMAKLDRRQRWAPLALALILGGAIGNLVDRLYLGYVVDFIQLYYQRWSWPAFNIADSAISVGAVMLIVRGPGYQAPEDDKPAK